MSAVSTSTDIKGLLKLALPIGSRLISGRPDTPVNWVCHLRTRPPVFADIEGGELVLVSTNTLANYQKPLSLETVIEELKQTNASVLGVRGTLTPRAHQVAKAHGFPLIALPDRAALPQVERAVQRLLTNREAQFVQRAFELQQTLQRHASGLRGLTTMLNALARMLNRPVVIHDRGGKVMGRGLPASCEREWDSYLELVDNADFVRRFPSHDTQWQLFETPVGMTAPLIHEDQVWGYISVLNTDDGFDEFDSMALEYSASTFVREIVRQQVAELSTEYAAAGRDWIADWLSSPVVDDALLARRAEKDDFQPDAWYATVLFHWTPGGERAGNNVAPDQIVKLIRAEMRQRRIPALAGQYVDRAVVLFPLDEPQQTQRLKQVVDLLHTTLSQAVPGGEVTASVGCPAQGLTALRESLKEAERTLTLSEQLWNRSQVAFFGEYNLYELLLGVCDAKMLADFCDRWLAPLVRYDDRHRTDLLPTLSAYFDNNGNMARTAHVLNVHRNTLVYRLNRITEIIQLDMDDANVRLNLQLALKIRHMLTASG